LEEETIKNKHNQLAPYWGIALFLFLVIGLSTINFELGSFWNGYVLDMVGPAWNYILFRGLFVTKADNTWTRFFTPNKTLFIFMLFCFCIEACHYLNLYESHFDSWDFIAYISILIPLYILDRMQME